MGESPPNTSEHTAPSPWKTGEAPRTEWLQPPHLCSFFFFFPPSFMVHFPSVWVSKPRLISKDEYTVCKSIADSCCAPAFVTFVETADFKSQEQTQD